MNKTIKIGFFTIVAAFMHAIARLGDRIQT